MGVTLHEYEASALLYTNMKHRRYFIRIWNMGVTLHKYEASALLYANM